MILTLHAEDLRRFLRIASNLIHVSGRYSLNFIEYRGKPALAVAGADWALIVTIRGRAPKRAFRVPLKVAQKIPNNIEGKISVQIEPEKGFGEIRWSDDSASFEFGLGNFTTCKIPPESTQSRVYPKSLLTAFSKCSRICRGSWPTMLENIRLTPDGEIGASNGKQLLILETNLEFPWQKPLLVWGSRIFTMREIQKRETFRLSAADDWVRFDFGDVLFFSKPDVDHFPNLHGVLPQEDEIRTRLTLDLKDAAFVKKHLAAFVDRDEKEMIVTLFGNYSGEVSAHCCNETQILPLPHSSYEGETFVLRTERDDLLAALSHGCHEIRLGGRYPVAVTENLCFSWVPQEASILPLESEMPSRSGSVVSPSE